MGARGMRRETATTQWLAVERVKGDLGFGGGRGDRAGGTHACVRTSSYTFPLVFFAGGKVVLIYKSGQLGAGNLFLIKRKS
jgi:hypothetical protein